MNKVLASIEISRNLISGAIVHLEPPAAHVKYLFEKSINNPTENQGNNNETLVSALKECASEYSFEKAELAVVIPRHSVFMRNITLPPTNSKEIHKILFFEAEKYIPFSTEEAVLQFYPLKPLSATEQNEIMLVAAKKDTIRKRIALFHDAGLFPAAVHVSSLALHNLLAFTKQVPETSFILVAIYEDAWEMNIYYNNTIIFSRGLKFTSSNQVEELIQEMHHSLALLESTYPNIHSLKIVITGDNADTWYENLKHRISTDISSLLLTQKPIPITFSDTSKKLSRYSLLLGACLPRVSDINLIPKEDQRFIHQKKKIKMYKTAAIVLLACFIASGGYYLFNNYQSISKNRALAKRIESSKKEIIALQRKAESMSMIDSYTKDSLLPLEVLREITLLLPSNTYILQLQYDHDSFTLQIKGRTNSYTTASAIVANMAGSSAFSHVVSKGSHIVKMNNNNLVDFEIVCTVNSKRGISSHGDH